MIVLTLYNQKTFASSFLFVGFRYRFLMKRHNIGSLQHEVRRQRRNNVLLLLIVTLYAISWLPFNISYILFTYGERYELSGKIFYR